MVLGRLLILTVLLLQRDCPQTPAAEITSISLSLQRENYSQSKGAEPLDALRLVVPYNGYSIRITVMHSTWHSTTFQYIMWKKLKKCARN